MVHLSNNGKRVEWDVSEKVESKERNETKRRV
jgi:hypothetical protein